jgi:hypothetical protein
MNKYLIIILLVVQSIIIKATEQYKDYLIVNNDIFEIDSPIDNISDSIFTKFWYNKLTKQNCINSACWRGAICTWTIRNDSLFLIRMKSCCDNNDMDLSVLKPNQKQIFANWITGTIDYSSGKKICSNIFYDLIIYGNSYDEFIYEYENNIVVSNGIIKIIRYDNRLTKCGRYKDEIEIKSEIESKLNFYTQTENDIEFSMFYNIDQEGHLTNMEIFGVKDSIVIKALISSLKKVDGLPVYYKKGKLKNDRFEGDFRITTNNTR